MALTEGGWVLVVVAVLILAGVIYGYYTRTGSESRSTDVATSAPTAPRGRQAGASFPDATKERGTRSTDMEPADRRRGT